jgi:hypothetical protein
MSVSKKSLLTRELLSKTLALWEAEGAQQHYLCHTLAEAVTGKPTDSSAFIELPAVIELMALLRSEGKIFSQSSCWHTHPAEKAQWLREKIEALTPKPTFKVGDKVQCAVQERERARNPKYTMWAGLVVTKVGIGGYYECVSSQGDTGGFWADDLSLTPHPKPRRDYVADHARRTLRRYGMTAEQAAKFVANLPPERRSAYSRDLPEDWSMTASFIWNDSPEGFDYWWDACQPIRVATGKY